MHCCEKCQLIQDEIHSRLEGYGYEMIAEYPEDKEEIIAEICSECYCDKMQSKICYANSNGCDEIKTHIPDAGNIHPDFSIFVKGRYKRRDRRYKEEQHKRHLKNLSKECRSYPAPVYYENAYYISGLGYIERPEENCFYKRAYRSNHKGSSCAYHKKMANKAVRRYNGNLQNGGMYKKCYDYWWNIC